MSHSKKSIIRLPLLPVTTRDRTRLRRFWLRHWWDRKDRMKEWIKFMSADFHLSPFLLAPVKVLHVSSSVYCATESTGGAPVSHFRLSPPVCGLSSGTGWQGWGMGPGSLTDAVSCSSSSSEGWAFKLSFSLRRISFLSLWKHYSTPMNFTLVLFKTELDFPFFFPKKASLGPYRICMLPTWASDVSTFKGSSFTGNFCPDKVYSQENIKCYGKIISSWDSSIWNVFLKSITAFCPRD